MNLVTVARIWLFLPFMMMASSCLTAKQKEARWETDFEREKVGCLPSGDCLPGECGKKRIECGITLDCGACPTAADPSAEEPEPRGQKPPENYPMNLKAEPTQSVPIPGHAESPTIIN